MLAPQNLEEGCFACIRGTDNCPVLRLRGERRYRKGQFREKRRVRGGILPRGRGELSIKGSIVDSDYSLQFAVVGFLFEAT